MVEQICSIHISKLGGVDKRIWGYINNGNFFVKSAYFVDLQHKKRQQEESSNGSIANGSWKRIWQLEVPSVVKTFLWKAVHNILLIRQNLYKRKIVENPFCSIYHMEEESITHVIWRCKHQIMRS